MTKGNYYLIIHRMPTIKRFRNFTISMYFDDHGVPHFHILSNNGNVSVAIDTMEVLAGSIPTSILKEAQAWASENNTLLHAKWKEFSL